MRVALVGALALLVAACGPAKDMSSAGVEPTIVSVPPGKLTTEIVGATPEQKEILLDALSGVGDRRIETITITDAEPGWGNDDGIGVSFEPRAKAADDMRFSWEAFLIGDALAERSREQSLPPVAYVSIPGETSALGQPAEHRGTQEAVAAFVTRLEKASKLGGVNVRE